MKKPKKPKKEDIDDEENDFQIDNFKNATIEIRGEGYLDKGKIIDIKETKNDVLITYKSRWGEITQQSIYFDEFREIKETGKSQTMDGEIVIYE